MFQLKPSHDGVNLKFKFRTPNGIEEADGRVHIHGTSFLVFSNSRYLNGGSSWSGASPYPEYKYYYNFSSNGTISRHTLSESLASVTLDEFPLLYKQDNQGGLFRRIYKKDADLYFLGSIQKDPENCKKPCTGPIVIMDGAYLAEKGWIPYKKETPAEDKLKFKKAVS